ncbi:MAG: SDR family oxidoreductase [Spirochaetales bacterium]|nr:SDR family oxidoreductase [Spirochaetales bacterium]
MRLAGKVAVVTGAGAGIGRTIAGAFAAEGAEVCLASRRSINGQPAADGIVAQGGTALFCRCDVSDEADVQRLFDRVAETFGRVDILVNNAGVNFVKPFERMEIADWDRVVNTDLRGTFLCSRLAIRDMLKRRHGSIINVASVHSVACLPGAAPYDAAKWGIVGLTKALAVEFASRNIRVNALSPGLIDTQIWTDIVSAAPDREQCLHYWRSNIPMGRVGSVEEIARAAMFLASDESSYLTGANIVVDGGMTSQLISAEPYESTPLEGT